MLSTTATASGDGPLIAFGRGSNLTKAGSIGNIRGGREGSGGFFAFSTVPAAGGDPAERMRITAAGNVGIGTSSPAVPLDVQTDSAAIGVQLRGRPSDDISVLRFRNNAANTTYGQFDVRSTDFRINAVANIPMLFNTNDTERMRIDSAGNVGIGTSAPTQKLDITGSGTQRIQLSSAGGAVGPMAATSTALFFGTTTSSDAIFVSNDSERMRITSAGNVGIGTTSPAGKLDISRPQNDVSTGSFTNPHLSLTALGTSIDNTGFVGISYASSGVTNFGWTAGAQRTGVTGSATAFVWRYHNDSAIGVERMRIDSGGNLLVGTTSSVNVGSGSADGLTVYPGISASGVIQASANGNIAMYLRRRSSNGSIVQFHRDTTNVGRIEVTTTATSYVTSSDYRLKHDIQPLTGALAKVAQLKPVTYKWNADDSDGEGFIAHEIQEVAPYAVSGEKDGEQMQGVDYGKITPLLTAALQEAVAEIQLLKARVAELEAK